MKRHVAIGAAAIALVFASCSSDDEEATTSPAPPDGVEAPNEGATTPSAPGALPPEFVRCMADQGFDVESSADIHSAPPRVLQACFGSLHSGGASR